MFERHRGLAYWLLGSAAAMIVGSFGPWASVLGMSVSGTDGSNDGWNEIHAIHACHKIGEKDVDAPWPVLPDGTNLADPTAVETLMDTWCNIFKGSTGAEGGGNRTDPPNQWTVHPLLDGCDAGPIIV